MESDLLYLVKFIVLLIIFIVACIFDLKKRIVPNKIWLFAILMALPLNVYEYILLKYNLINPLLWIAFIFVISYAMYLFDFFGGADVKALVTLAIFFPAYPKFFCFPLLNFHFSLAFATLSNSVIFASIILFFFLLKNLKKEGLKNFKLVYFFGFKVKIEEIPKFYNLLQFVTHEGEVQFTLKGVEPSQEIIENLKSRGIKEVWVTPALPFIVFITVGFILAVFIGNLIFLLFSFRI